MMMTPAVSLLRQYLEERRDAGKSHVTVSREALQLLGGLAAKAERNASSSVQEESRTPVDSPTRVNPAKDAAVGESLVLNVAGASREEKLQAVKSLAEKAPEAKGLGTLRETMVFAAGNPHAALMLIGEAPGHQEERQQEPFVGPAGEKLTQILKAMGLSRGDVYISNICKYRPRIDEAGGQQGTRNRKPTEQEMRACLPFVMTEIDIIRPRCIIALGATAAEGLGLTGSVGQLRGKAHEIHGIPVLATYHPSYVLRQEEEEGGMRVKRQVWEDMLQAMEILGMPISAKQQGYFKAV